MRVWIASDHAGYELKRLLVGHLEAQGYEVKDIGAHSAEATDYPDWVHALIRQMPHHEQGVLICGSGNGVCMTANKYRHIRAALAWNQEIARLARAHNDANVLCLPARFIEVEEAIRAVERFLHTPFEGGRHQRRIEKIVF
ncbi:MAG: ribose 5-phosphate isomerase B [Bacteroidia bacterium]